MYTGEGQPYLAQKKAQPESIELYRTLVDIRLQINIMKYYYL